MAKSPHKKTSVEVRAAIVEGEPSVVLAFDDGTTVAFSADEAAQVIVSMTNAIKALASFGGSRAD